MKHLHIPGGNTGSVLAQSRATEVMELAARCRSWAPRFNRSHQELEQENYLETE